MFSKSISRVFSIYFPFFDALLIFCYIYHTCLHTLYFLYLVFYEFCMYIILSFFFGIYIIYVIFTLADTSSTTVTIITTLRIKISVPNATTVRIISVKRQFLFLNVCNCHFLDTPTDQPTYRNLGLYNLPG